MEISGSGAPRIDVEALREAAKAVTVTAMALGSTSAANQGTAAPATAGQATSSTPTAADLQAIQSALGIAIG